LRELLGRDAPFVLVATATSLIEATSHHDAPFYDFFQTIVLDDLSVDEVTELILARARWDGEKTLLSQSDRLRERVRAMYHFSGGNPRLVMALYGVLRRGVTDALYTELLELLDAVTPYYQARLQDVSPQSERVLAEMALAGRRLTPAVIAKRCRMPTNQVTALVSKLEAERFIAPTGRPDGRSRYYDLSDRLFRIWMQMREDRGARQRLRFLSDFFQRWYAGRPDEVDDAMKKTSVLLWTDVHEAATQKIRERLRTLDYLRDAVPDAGVPMALRHVGIGTIPGSEQDARAWIACLEPLFSDESSFVRIVAGLLAAPAFVALGRPREADQALEIGYRALDRDLAAVALLAIAYGPDRWLTDLVARAASSRAAQVYLWIRAIAVVMATLLEIRERRSAKGFDVSTVLEEGLTSRRETIAHWFGNDAIVLLREDPERSTELLALYEGRHAMALSPEISPIAPAIAVGNDPEHRKELSPEVREAAELLIGRASGETKPHPAGARTVNGPRLKPYRVDATGTASLAAERSAPKARGRGKVRT
jgi:hypothetical protein